MTTPEDLAALHARAFAGQGRGWSATEFAELLASPLICLCAGPRGFALSRVVADEAELLTLATDPAHRRQGVAAALLAEIESTVRRRGATCQFLEVAADNVAARALYAAAGYAQTGRRAGYYARDERGRVDALLLSKALDRAR